MKKLITGFLIIALVSLSSSVLGEENLQSYAENSENLWQTGKGASDGSYTAISTSMIAWGVGLAIGIAVLCAVLHQSKSGGGHHHNHSH